MDRRPSSVGEGREGRRARGASRSAPDAHRLVLDAVRATEAASGRPEEDFVLRRARQEVEGLAHGREAALLRRVLAVCGGGCGESGDSSDRVRLLLGWAGFLERRGRLGDAADVLAAAADGRPGDAELTLHRARLARKLERPDEARDLYRSVRARNRGPGRLSRMAEVGLALLDGDREATLGRILRRAVRDGDREAAAVAQEERARARRRDGDLGGALRDYGAAAARFRDPVDRGRIGHEVADVLIAAGDPLAARRVLLEVAGVAHPEQAARARARLVAVSRALGDEVGVRRWKDHVASGLVSLAPPPGASPGPSLEPRVRAGIRRLAKLGAPAGRGPRRPTP